MELLQFDIDIMAISLALLGFVTLLAHLYSGLVMKPRRLRSQLTNQGISGPPPWFFLGHIMQIDKACSSSGGIDKAPTMEASTLHNNAAILFPIFEQWRKQDGEVFSFSLGNTPILYVNKHEVVKKMVTCTSWDCGKPTYQHKDRGPLFGQGIVISNGASWAHQRKLIVPELYMDKVNGMFNLITECSVILLNSWNNIKIDNYIRRFSGDAISRACFGSNYAKGEQIFQKLDKLQHAIYLPTKSNRKAWAIEKEIANLILKTVKERQAAGHEKDLMQMILEGAINSGLGREATDQFISVNCKNIYLAGNETTAISATWTLMLLASNLQWQERVRAEVLEVCQGRTPDADMLLKMKRLTMVIHESMRLYPPTPVVSREAFADMKFEDIIVPKGVIVWTVMLTLHTDPEIWGPDSYTFNPERFANGIIGACKLPQLYIPFGVGPRVCIGQNFAMAELKVLISLILSKFSFSVSPNYIHKPSLRLLIEAEHGVRLLVRKL
ncbi:cytochrome P450 734A1-like [Pyrus ussuriensis x Pyrus communis]|uniref:Cytochrome P450 734A1-like n=1 Tax=Pyrus ussuriensis x Pyrus communis TaxID=2448454 RepID=A0A5N5I7U5_9ROSA|nr:cytochrome P450 734A1-like [Pyrus ussuriensis x Pyrus communis]